MKKNINDFNFFDKKVLLRLDLNVPISNGKIESTKRIDEALPTIKALEIKMQELLLFRIWANLMVAWWKN